jgi:hypothetical protein
MEALNAIFSLANSSLAGFSRLASLWSPTIRHRVSLYADDLVVFLSTVERDIILVRAILEIFACYSGLRTNVSKCQLTPIRCNPEQIELVQQLFPCQLFHFPCKYLGDLCPFTS